MVETIPSHSAHPLGMVGGGGGGVLSARFIQLAWQWKLSYKWMCGHDVYANEAFMMARSNIH